MKMVHEWLSRPNPYYKATRHRDSSAGISWKYEDWHHWFFRLVVGVTLKNTKWKSSELPRPVGDDFFAPFVAPYLAPNDPDFWEFRPRISRKKLGNPQKVVNSQNRGRCKSRDPSVFFKSLPKCVNNHNIKYFFRYFYSNFIIFLHSAMGCCNICAAFPSAPSACGAGETCGRPDPFSGRALSALWRSRKYPWSATLPGASKSPKLVWPR